MALSENVENVDLQDLIPLVRCLSESGIPRQRQLKPRHFETAAGLAEWIYDPRKENLPVECDKEPMVQEEDPEKGHFTQVAIVSTLDAIFVVWRGTQTKANLACDISLVPVPYKVNSHLTLNLHSGFNTLLENDVRAFADQITTILRISGGVKKIIFTGHSLGGAIATLALLRSFFPSKACEDELRKQLKMNRDKFYAITFGAPMVMASYGEDTRLEAYVNERCFNIVNQNDLIPRLPGQLQYLLDHPDSMWRVVEQVLQLDGPFMQALGRVLPGKMAAKSKEALMEQLKECDPIAKGYRHIGRVLKLDGLGHLHLVKNGRDLLNFDEEHEKENKGSMGNDHQRVAYLLKTKQVVQPVANEDNAELMIASFKPVTRPQTLWQWVFSQPPEYLPELQIQAERQNLENASRRCTSLEEASRVTAFAGNSTNGKSFLIAHIIGAAATDTKTWKKPFYTARNSLGNTTTAGVYLFNSDIGYFLDCEGTKGKDVPATLTSVLRDIGSRVVIPTGHRAAQVQKTLPPLSMMLATVFCYVVREHPGNRSAYEEILEYARQCLQLVQNCEKPVLIVIQNKVPTAELAESFEDLTAALLVHEDENEPLRYLFSRIHVVQVPSLDPRHPEEFQPYLAALRDLIKNGSDWRIEASRACGTGMTQKQWFSATLQYVDSIGSGQPVSVANVLNLTRQYHSYNHLFSGVVPLDTAFSDVVTLYMALLSSPLLKFNTKSKLEGLVQDAREQAINFASKIIEKRSSALGITDLTSFEPELRSLVARLVSATPCQAECPYGVVCGQPGIFHAKTHSSFNLWPETSKRITWPGAHDPVDIDGKRFVERVLEVVQDRTQRCGDAESGAVSILAAASYGIPLNRNMCFTCGREMGARSVMFWSSITRCLGALQSGGGVDSIANRLQSCDLCVNRWCCMMSPAETMHTVGEIVVQGSPPGSFKFD